jgi:hypothetical protein
MSPEPPFCPPVVGLASGPVGHLLCGERHDRDGSWQAWVPGVQESGSRPVHKLVCVPSGSVTQLESPDACRKVPRRVRGEDGQIRAGPNPAWCTSRSGVHGRPRASSLLASPAWAGSDDGPRPRPPGNVPCRRAGLASR